MRNNVEILVSHDTASFKDALGLPSTWFSTQPSRRRVERILVAWLADLDSIHGRANLESLCQRTWKTWRHVPVVFIATKSAMPQTGAAFQAIAHCSRKAEQEPFIASDPAVVRRMALARQSDAEGELIASASVEDGKLVVWSCEPTRYDVPVSEIPALAKMSPDSLMNFEVSQSGSRIHWPDGDVDLNLDTVRERADAEIRRQHEAWHREEAARYADAIRVFREERGLKQNDLGLSERQVRRLEAGETIPHRDTLRKLAHAHQMPVDDYLKELAKRSSRKGPSKVGQRTTTKRRRARISPPRGRQ
jgi:hypothetical protein